MARSTLIVYEPLTDSTDRSYYWKEYVQFYEQYWGGPTSPFGVWFGNEYASFINALASNLGIDRDEIQHCFFTKDEEGNYYVAPCNSRANLFYSENFIPLEWFVLFSEDDRQTLYTHWGFNALHYDTRISQALGRISRAEGILSSVADSVDAKKSTCSHTAKNLLQGMAELKAWLSGFDPGGFLVLNYGEICSVINPYTLENERSIEEMWRILTLLEEQKFAEADSSLRILIQKWEEIGSRASGERDKSTIQ